MPKFKVFEQITEVREVEADSAQEALEAWLLEGDAALVGHPSITVTDRWVEDENGNMIETEEP